MNYYKTVIGILLTFGLFSCKNSENNEPAKTIELKEATIVGDENINTPFGEMVLEGTYLTQESINRLNKQLAVQRASEVYQWGLPFVNFQKWYEQSQSIFGAQDMDFVVHESFNEKLGIITANATTPYVIGFVNLKNSGPIVLNIPAGKIAGGILNFYELAVQDLGLVGPDQGKGGQYLVIPPGFDESTIDTKGYFIARSETNKLFIGLRFLSTDSDEIDRIKAEFAWAPYGEEMRLSNFISGTNKVFRGHHERGINYFEILHNYIQDEPISDQDLIFKTYLNDLGIVDGESFNPDAETREILEEGAKLGELIARANQQQPRNDETYYPDRNWYRLLSNMPLARWDDTRYYLDESNQYLYEAVTITRGMKANNPGFAVSSYLTTHTDKNGEFLNGSNTYKLHLNKDIPAENFWSFVVYSQESRCFIVNKNNNNDLRSCSINSRMKNLSYNEDGSIDLYIGPEAPEGRESNWIQTPKGEGWFPLFRFYGTEQAFFDKTWVIGDLEKI